MLKSFLRFAAIALTCAFAFGHTASAADATKATAPAAKAKAKKHRVIFHVTDSDPVKWNQVLNNAGNLQKNVGKENITVEVVVNGPGLDMMKLESVVGNRMEDAVKNGIDLLACGATMKATNVTEKDLFPGVKVVPGGVLQIMQRQEARWTYIKI